MLLTLFRNVLAIVISTITVMIVLSQVGLNIAPLLAGAGALGWPSASAPRRW